MNEPTNNKHTMKNSLLFIGLDVHAQNITIALADEAEAAGVSVAVPFIFRLSDLLKLLETQERPGAVDHASFRFMAGPPGRYPGPTSRRTRPFAAAAP